MSSPQVLTFADAGSVHHPDEGGAVFTVGGDAVLSGLEDVAVVLLHLQGAAEALLSSKQIYYIQQDHALLSKSKLSDL